MEFQTIVARVLASGTGIITLNRPQKRNAISIRMRQEVSVCLAAWRDASEVGAVVISGAGSVFSAGFDLDEFKEPARFPELLESSSRYHRDLWNFPKPTIAAVNGPAMGGGLDLATLCDMRICAASAVFGHPEVKFGAPPLITPLRWIVGEGNARDLCLTGRRIAAEEAYRIGLVSGVEEPVVLLDHALKLATVIQEAPADTLRFAKEAFIGTAGTSFDEAFAVEHDRAFREVLLKRFAGAELNEPENARDAH